MAPPSTGSNIKDRAAELAGRFTTGQKALMVGVTLVVVVAIFFITKAASQQEMSPLYSNLKPADASAVTEKLTAEGTSYTLADGGATIMVPKDKVYDLRLKMAADGLPQSSPEGYALLDKQGITTSEFSQQVGFQRAMEGELAKTIGTMDPVEQATVHLAIPRDNVFAASQAKASASVLIKVKPGKQLDSGQVQAVVHLVASSVNGLAPEAVTVADSKGQVLAAPGTDGAESTASDLNTKQRAAYEKTLANSIQTMVEPVVGAGKAKVTVAADLDFSTKNATSETFQQPSGNPAQGTPQVQSNKTETYTGAGAADAGVLGPDGAPVAGNGSGNSNYELNQSETKNALNRVVEQTKAAPGSVRRLSVAVLLDSANSSADQVTQIQNLVAAAAGINTQRGDAVQVSRLQFDTAEADAQQKEMEEAQAAEAKAATMGMVRQAVVILFLAALLFLVYRSMRKAARRRPGMLYAGEVREITPSGPSEPLVLERPASTLPAERDEPEEELVLAPVQTEEQRQRDRITRQVEQMIDQQPVEVAQMLRGWLGEGKKGARR